MTDRILLNELNESTMQLKSKMLSEVSAPKLASIYVRVMDGFVLFYRQGKKDSLLPQDALAQYYEHVTKVKPYSKPSTLNNTDIEILNKIICTRTEEAQRVQHAKILLLSASGMSNVMISDKFDIRRNSVVLCLRKYATSGIKSALKDDSGRVEERQS